MLDSPSVRFPAFIRGLSAVVLFAGSVHAQTPAKWTLTQDLRIGGGDRGVDYEFANIRGFALGPNGSVLVADRPPPVLRQYDARGNFVRAIGRIGGGPGEFRLLSSFGFLGDTLWTVDQALRRLSFFTAEGQLITTILNSAPEDGANIWAVFPRGDAVGRAGFSPFAAGEGKVRAAPLLRMTRDARTLDTIAWVSTQNMFGVLRAGNAQSLLMQTFSDAPMPVVAPPLERVFIVDRTVATSPREAAIRVVALSVSGDTVWSRRYPYVPKRLEAAAIDGELSRAIGIDDAKFTGERLRPYLFLPEFRPPVSDAIAAADGSLWLRREDGSDASVNYLVIGPAGNAMATITVKRTVTIKAVSADFVWAVETDEDRVETIVRFRITR